MKAEIDTEKLIAWYNFQAPFYSLWRDQAEHQALATVLEVLGPASGLSVLDAGCGSGLFALALASHRPTWKVSGVDASKGMIELARRRAQSQALSNLSIEVGDLRTLGWADRTFDAVVVSGVFPNLSEPLPVSREIWRVLKTGGLLVVVEFNRERMSALTKLFFRLMIWGYRTVSTFFRQFRFAEGWSLEKTTIPATELVELLGQAGFQHEQTTFLANYYILTFCKEEATARPPSE